MRRANVSGSSWMIIYYNENNITPIILAERKFSSGTEPMWAEDETLLHRTIVRRAA